MVAVTTVLIAMVTHLMQLAALSACQALVEGILNKAYSCLLKGKEGLVKIFLVFQGTQKCKKPRRPRAT